MRIRGREQASSVLKCKGGGGRNQQGLGARVNKEAVTQEGAKGPRVIPNTCEGYGGRKCGGEREGKGGRQGRQYS